MNPKFLVLYLVAATIVLLFTIYQVTASYPALNTPRIIIDFLISLAFYYLAYKTHHEKKDKELM